MKQYIYIGALLLMVGCGAEVKTNNYLGKRAESFRSYTYERGIREARHGDSAKASGSSLSSIEYRLKLLEDTSKLHSLLIQLQSETLSAFDDRLAQALIQEHLISLQEQVDELVSLESSNQADTNLALDILLAQITAIDSAIDQAIDDYAATDQECTAGTQLISVSLSNQYDGDCGRGNHYCRESDLDGVVIVTFPIPSVTCN